MFGSERGSADPQDRDGTIQQGAGWTTPKYYEHSIMA